MTVTDSNPGGGALTPKNEWSAVGMNLSAANYYSRQLAFVDDVYVYSKGKDPETGEPTVDGLAMEYIAKGLCKQLALKEEPL